MTNVGGTLFFAVSNDSDGRELWKSDGTLQGTVRLKTIVSGPAGALSLSLANANGKLFLAAIPQSGPIELWKSDGTPQGTVLVARPPILGKLVPFGTEQTVLFTAYEVNTGWELWTSDGTAAGTHLLYDIAPGVASSAPSFITNVGSTVFFTANDIVHGVELWAIAPPLSVYMPLVRFSPSN